MSLMTHSAWLKRLIIDNDEAAGISHDRLYSVHCARINCSYENIMVLGLPQVFDENIL